MTNPDGVVMGNSRASFIGRDINRCFAKPDRKLIPEAHNIRELIRSLQVDDRERVIAYFDMHAHSGRKSVFIYGPYYPLHLKQYLKVRFLPKLISERNHAFRYYSCKFKHEGYKQGCARISLWRDFNISNSYTVETSAFGYINKDRRTFCFDESNLAYFGECLGQSIFEFVLIQEEHNIQKRELAKKLK